MPSQRSLSPRPSQENRPRERTRRTRKQGPRCLERRRTGYHDGRQTRAHAIRNVVHDVVRRQPARGIRQQCARTQAQQGREVLRKLVQWPFWPLCSRSGIYRCPRPTPRCRQIPDQIRSSSRRASPAQPSHDTPDKRQLPERSISVCPNATGDHSPGERQARTIPARRSHQMPLP